MNKELKAKWIEALRSGRYKQGQRMLRLPDDSFCCLGVLCDCLNPKEWKGVIDGDCDGLSWSWRGDIANAPFKLLHPNLQGYLTAMNDNQCLDFNKIADWIEEKIPEDE